MSQIGMGIRFLVPHMCVNSYLVYKVFLLFLVEVQNLSPLVSSPILWATLLSVALVTYKLGLNVLNTNWKNYFFNTNVDEVILNLLHNKRNVFFYHCINISFWQLKSLKCKIIFIKYVTTLNLNHIQNCILFRKSKTMYLVTTLFGENNNNNIHKFWH
jgi:hypothetical protein